jgi:hypothetical protein
MRSDGVTTACALLVPCALHTADVIPLNTLTAASRTSLWGVLTLWCYYRYVPSGRQSEFGRDAMSVPKADPRASESSDSSSGGPGNNQKMDVKMFIKYVH